MADHLQSGAGPAVLAFGGNALLPDPFRPEEQEQRADQLAQAVLMLLQRSSGLVLVHGNGPQVGMILLRVEETRERLPAEPLDMLVAETQGSVGYLLSRALRNALRKHSSHIEVASLLTQVVVDPADRAFAQPTKPVGPFYAAKTAEFLSTKRGWDMVEEQGRGWRRVVPSPAPRRVVELEVIRQAVRFGGVVIAGGGGGVPVSEGEDGFDGVEAVVDKDRTAALIAKELHASSLVILTGVSHVSRAFGTPSAERIARVSSARARELIEAGEFPRGSMRPKMEAACDYVEARKQPAVITDMGHLRAALVGDDGTWIVP